MRRPSQRAKRQARPIHILDGIHPQGRLEHQAVIIDAVLNVLAVGADLTLQGPIQPAPTQSAPSGVTQRAAGRVERRRLGDQVIVVLCAGVDQGGRDARGVLRNGLRQARASFYARTCFRFLDPRRGEDLSRPHQRHQPNSHLLPVHPMRTQVGGIGFDETLEITPEGFGVDFVLRQTVGAAKRVDPAKAGGFPDEFDVREGRAESSEVLRMGFVFCPVTQGLVEGQLQFDRFAAKPAEFARHDLVRFGQQGALTVLAQDLGQFVSRRERK